MAGESDPRATVSLALAAGERRYLLRPLLFRLPPGSLRSEVCVSHFLSECLVVDVDVGRLHALLADIFVTHTWPYSQLRAFC